MVPPFRAEHIGSMLRPQPFLQARNDLAEKKPMSEAFNSIRDSAIVDIVKTQVNLGFRGVTDGEYSRDAFVGNFFVALEGYEYVDEPDISTLRTYGPDIAVFTNHGRNTHKTCVAKGKIKHVGSANLEHWNFLKAQLPADRVREAKITLPSPWFYHIIHRKGKAYAKGVYANDNEYFADIIVAYRRELEILYDAGCRNIQIDDPKLSFFCHKPMLEGFVRDGEDSTALFNTYISNYHKILDSQPQDLHIGMHLCRGNFKSIGFAEGSYEAIAETLFQKLPISTYYLEFDTPRAGDFTPLLHLPADKHVVLGLVSTKFGEIEDFEILKERVLEAASMVAKGTGQATEMALKSLSVSPQCGFASVWMGNNIVWQDMITKLTMVRKLADEIWPGEL